MNTSLHLIVGLPMAGKTSFLAALWHVLDQPEVSTSLVLHGMPADREYLNQIRDEWIRCRHVARTALSSQRTVNLTLSDKKSGTKVELSFPDLSGEVFAAQLEERQWSDEFDRQVAQASGVLLFLNPGSVVEPQGIEDVWSLADALGAPVESGSAVVEPWRPSHVPTQVNLVEILQLLKWRRQRGNLRVGIVVSAWDLIGPSQTPQEWIRQRLPLLDQFVSSNTDWLTTSIYGISAQGGTYSPDTVDALLRAHPRPSKRIVVVGPGCDPHVKFEK
jgi:hypothetical protein